MMKHKLHELLQEDQEPFHLQDYINDRRQRLHSRPPKPTLTATSNFTTKLCKKACFFSGGDSPDLVESPEVRKPPKNVFFLHVSARTAAVLVEASARIRKQKKLDAPKQLGSFLKNLKQSSSNKRKKSRDEKEEDVGVLLKNILKYDLPSTAFIGRSVTRRQNSTFSPEIPDISIDQNLDFETEFSSTPFRFVLPNDSYTHQTPNSSLSSAGSPSTAETEIGEKCDVKDLIKQYGNEGEKEEDEEHCSPVSVLDPDPYVQEEDDGDDIEEKLENEDSDNEESHEEDDDESSSFDMDRSYDNVQRAQERLLEKLSRFEKLAELDPLELEVRFQEDEQEDLSDGFNLSEEERKCKEIESSSNKRALSYLDLLVKEVLNRPEFNTSKRVPAELKRVTKVIITEEELKLVTFDDKSILLERVVRRLAQWKGVAGDIMSTMAGYDITWDLDGWARKQEQVTVAAMDIELAIFEALLEELCEEL